MPGVSGEWFRPFALTGDELGRIRFVYFLYLRSDVVGVLGVIHLVNHLQTENGYQFAVGEI